MGFQEAVQSALSKYVDFTGRASRSEYWWFVLFSIVVQVVAQIVDYIIFIPLMQFSLLYALAALALLLPGLAVAFRRIHDVDRTAWWLLIAFTVIGALVLLYWFVQPGTRGSNRFGGDPLQGVRGAPSPAV